MSIEIKRKNEDKIKKQGDFKMVKGSKYIKWICSRNWSITMWNMNRYMNQIENRIERSHFVQLVPVACFKQLKDYKKAQDFEHKKKREFFSYLLGL